MQLLTEMVKKTHFPVLPTDTAANEKSEEVEKRLKGGFPSIPQKANCCSIAKYLVLSTGWEHTC